MPMIISCATGPAAVFGAVVFGAEVFGDPSFKRRGGIWIGTFVVKIRLLLCDILYQLNSIRDSRSLLETVYCSCIGVA